VGNYCGVNKLLRCYNRTIGDMLYFSRYACRSWNN